MPQCNNENDKLTPWCKANLSGTQSLSEKTNVEGGKQLKYWEIMIFCEAEDSGPVCGSSVGSHVCSGHYVPGKSLSV